MKRKERESLFGKITLPHDIIWGFKLSLIDMSLIMRKYGLSSINQTTCVCTCTFQSTNPHISWIKTLAVSNTENNM